MSRMEPFLYREVQGFRQWHTRIILAFPPASLLFVTARQVIFHKPWGSPPASDGGLIFLTVLLTAVYFRLVTVKLVIEIRGGELGVGLRGLWKRRRIPVRQIQTAEAVTFDPVADFGGYGIRSGRGGQAYIAQGNCGVALSLNDGQKVIIGSQSAPELRKRILEVRRQVNV